MALRHRRVARANRVRAGFCPECGYDLRASTARCPECGSAIVRPPKPAESHWDTAAVARRYLSRYTVPARAPRAYQPADLCQIPEVDQVFLDRRTREMIVLGFKPIGDLMAGISRLQAFRVFLSEDGEVVASVGAVFTVGAHPSVEELRFVSYRSELSDGTFVITEALICGPLNRITPPIYPGIDVDVSWDQDDPAQLLERHKGRITERLEQLSNKQIVPSHDLAEVLVSQRRLETLRCSHQPAQKSPDEQTLRAAFPSRSSEWLDAFVAEVQRLKREEMASPLDESPTSSA